MDELTRLALAASKGDRRATEQFIRRAQADVWRLCSHLGDADVADDLTQETFVRAWRALPKFRGDASARTWVLSIARRVCADHVRGASRRRRLRDRMVNEHRGRQVPEPGGAVDLHELVRSLGDEQRAAFVLTQVLGLSYDQAAEVCDCPIGTVRSRIARAREALVDQLEYRAAEG